MTLFPARLDHPPQTVGQLRKALVLDFPSGHLTSGLDPASIVSDNLLRASWGAHAVICFADRTMGGGEHEDFLTAIGDLLADLRHLADALGEDYADWDERGHRHYLPELAGEG